MWTFFGINWYGEDYHQSTNSCILYANCQFFFQLFLFFFRVISIDMMEFEHKINNYQTLKFSEKISRIFWNSGKWLKIWLFSSVGSEPKLGLARFWLELLGKRLGSARHAFKKAWPGSARHILQKKLGSARLALWFKKPSYLKNKKWADFQHFCHFFKV